MPPARPEPPAEGVAEPPVGSSARGSKGRGAGRDLSMAVVSGLTLAVTFIGTLALNGYAFVTFFTILVVIGLLELDVAFREHGLRPATPVAIGVGIILMYGAYASGPEAQSLALVLVVFATLAWGMVDPAGDPGTGRRPPRVAASFGATFLAVLWVPFLASYSGLLLRLDEGRWALFATVLLVAMTDIGAYAIGMRFGRHKLAPAISPGKTWEGLVGGLLVSGVIAALAVARMPGFDLVTALALGAGVAVAGTVGDLAESLIKRDLGVKDLGRIVPGHGGIMDRADAVLFALPTAHFLLTALR